MKRVLFILALYVLVPVRSHAHFIWLLPDATAGKSHVYFGEAAEPDDPALLEKISKAEIWSIPTRGEPRTVTLTKSSEGLEAPLNPAERQSTLILRHAYGVVSKGGEPFLLNYYAKAYPFPIPRTWRSVKDSDRLPLEITPSLEGNSVTLSIVWKGSPLAGSTITIVGPGIDKKIEGTSDESGKFRYELPQGGLFSIRAKHSESIEGKWNGQSYKSTRHYSTLTLPYEPARLVSQSHQFPELPEGTTSFGGAISGDTLFVFGGNYGSAHEYVNEDQSGDLWKLNLQRPSAWERVECGPKRQGLAMVEHQGKIYRIGGFVANNKGSEAEDLRSQADFARLDSSLTKWEELVKLPEPRSSHDAAVVGDVLYVVGGWNMQGAGGSTAKWHDTALAMKLTADKLEWKEIPAPGFKRRALALAAWNGKLVCIGGMQEKGGPTTATAVFDPAVQKWNEGPTLLGSAMDGFGSSAFSCQGDLYVTTISGSIQVFAENGKQWKYAGQLKHPRFFHRLLPWNDSELVIVGGASMETGKVTALEILHIRRTPNVTRVSE